MDFHGFPLIFIDFNGFPWISIRHLALSIPFGSLGGAVTTVPSACRAPEPRWHKRARRQRGAIRSRLWATAKPSSHLLARAAALLVGHHGSAMPWHGRSYVVCPTCPSSWVFDYRRKANPKCESCWKPWPRMRADHGAAQAEQRGGVNRRWGPAAAGGGQAKAEGVADVRSDEQVGGDPAAPRDDAV